MKYNILCLAGIILFANCQSGDTHQRVSLSSTAVATVGDVTDKKLLWPVANPALFVLYQFEKYPDGEAWFHLAVISDKQVNPVMATHLQNAQVTELLNNDDDPQFRNKAILGFQSQIRQSVTNFYKAYDTTKTLNFSECYITICKELQWLTATKCTNKYLLIFSDLMEKSNALNAYRRVTKTDISAMAAQLARSCTVPANLKGVTVFIIYQPQTRLDDSRFTIMVAVYRKLLEPLGATIQVQASNTNYQP